MPIPTPSPIPSSNPTQSPTHESIQAISDEKAAESVLYLYSQLYNNQKNLLPLLQNAHLDAQAIGMLLASIGDILESNIPSSPTPPISPDLVNNNK